MPKSVAALAAACAAGALLFVAAPAQAGQKQPAVTDFSAQSDIVKPRPHKRPRVTVRQRSYLDAGTEVLPGERKYMDYAFPPNYSAFDVLGPGKNYQRSPLNGPWDVPSRY